MSLAPPAGVAQIAAALQARRPAAHCGFRLRLEELTLGVRTNSAAVADDLRGYFGSFVEADEARPADLEFLLLDGPAWEPPVALSVRPSAPGKRVDKERFADLPSGDGSGEVGGRIVRKQATGMVFVFGAGVNVAVGPCAANRNQLVNFLCARYMERRLAAGWMLGHAAGVARGGRALALFGFAGMGKSTLALHLLARGWDFVSNDRVLVQPAASGSGGAQGPVLHGIPKQPRLNPGTALGNPALAPRLARALPDAARKAYAHLEPEALRRVEDKFDADIGACFGSRFRLAAPLGGVVALNWRHGGGGQAARRVDLGQRRDLLDALRKPPGLFYLPGALATARLTPEACLEALCGVPALELSGGSDFAAGALACEDFLGA